MLDFPVAPNGYRDDLRACLGLGSEASTVEALLATGERLVTGILALLEAHADVVCPLQPPELDVFLAEGTIRRYLEQGQITHEGVDA